MNANARFHHFNSIKVRLELEEAGLNPNLLMKFQFHKGAIRTCVLLVSLCLCCHFNSIKVRLEHIANIQAAPTATFQFHKGAIRTVSTQLVADKSVSFQFHKGAIRTLEADLLKANLDISIP